MQSGGRYQPGSELPGTREAVPLGDQLPQSADTEGASAPRAARRWWAAAAWAAAGPAFFMAGLAVMLASNADADRRGLLALAERLHPGASEVPVFARWLKRSPLRPSRFLPMLAMEITHAA